jgi:hypothetical protein
VAEFKHLVKAVTNQNCMDDKIKSRRLNSGNAFYHSVQNVLSSRLLSKNIIINVYKTITLHVVLYGCETWSLSLKLRGKQTLREFKDMLLQRIFGCNEEEVVGD